MNSGISTVRRASRLTTAGDSSPEARWLYFAGAVLEAVEKCDALASPRCMPSATVAQRLLYPFTSQMVTNLWAGYFFSGQRNRQHPVSSSMPTLRETSGRPMSDWAWDS